MCLLKLCREHPLDELPGCPAKIRSPSSSALQSHHKYREKDRLVLRGFLNRLATYPKVPQSQTLRDFLTNKPITLNHEEKYDAEKRALADKARAAEEERFRSEVDRQVIELNKHLAELKRELLTPGKRSLPIKTYFGKNLIC